MFNSVNRITQLNHSWHFEILNVFGQFINFKSVFCWNKFLKKTELYSCLKLPFAYQNVAHFEDKNHKNTWYSVIYHIAHLFQI